MDYQYQEYYKVLKSTSKGKINSTYKLEKYCFSNLQYVHSFLLENALRADATNIQITLPNNESTEKLALPVLITSVLFSIVNNQGFAKANLNIGDYLIDKKQNDIFSVSRIEGNQIFVKKDTYRAREQLLSNNYIKIVKEYYVEHFKQSFSRTKTETFAERLLKVYKEYSSILSLIVDQKIRVPEIFKSRIIIIAKKSDIIPCIPVHFPYDSFNSKVGLERYMPFSPCLIISSDLKNIKDLIESDSCKYSTIIFIGSNKYGPHQSYISRIYRLKKIYKCIFVGGSDIESSDNFPLLKWNWTVTEMNFFHRKTDDNITIESVSDKELSDAIEKYISFINSLEKKYENLINLKSLFKYIRKVYSCNSFDNFSIEEIAEGIYNKFLEEASELFSDQYCNIDCDYCKELEQLSNIYNEIINIVKNKNQKTKWFQKCDNNCYIVLPNFVYRKFTESPKLANDSKNKPKTVNDLSKLKSLFFKESDTIIESKINAPNSHIISLKDFEDQKKTTRVFLFPSIYGYGLYLEDFITKIQVSGLDVKLLCYNEEYKAFHFYMRKLKKETENELQSKDRKILSGVKYNEILEGEDVSIEDWIQYLIDNEFEEKRVTQSDDIKYEIFYEDGTKTIERSSKCVYIEDYEDYNKEVCELKKGDKVRIYQNPDKVTLHDIIKVTDEKDLFTRVDNYSSLWKNALVSLYNQFLSDYRKNVFKLPDFDSISEFQTTEPDKKPIDKLYEILCLNGLSVEKFRLESWIKKEDKTKFPKKKRDLLAIIKTVNNQELNKNVRLIFELKTEYYGRLNKAGLDFSEEINTYILSREKGKMLNWLSDNHIEEIISIGAPLRTIKEIRKINEESND